METTKKQLLKVREFASRVSASPSKIYEAIADGSIPSVRLAGMIRIPVAFADNLVRRALSPATDEDA